MSAAARFLFWWVPRTPAAFSPPVVLGGPMEWPSGAAMEWPSGSPMEWPG